METRPQRGSRAGFLYIRNQASMTHSIKLLTENTTDCGTLCPDFTPKRCGPDANYTVRSFEQVRHIEFLLFILQSNQNWGAINFVVNFHPLIQPNSRGSLNSFYGGGGG